MYFRREADDGIRYFFAPGGQTWIAQTNTGHTIQFGHPLDGFFDDGIERPDPNTLIIGGGTPNSVYRWALVRDTDATGNNTVYYTYTDNSALVPAGTAISGIKYLSDIYDTPPPNAPISLSTFAHHVHLSWLLSFGIIAPTTTNTAIWQAVPFAELSGVDVTSTTFSLPPPRAIVRRYHLAYTPNAAFTQDQLTSVILEGACSNKNGTQILENVQGILPANTGCPSLPQLTLTYTPDATTTGDPTVVQTDSNIYSFPIRADLSLASHVFVDVNGDGATDLVSVTDSKPGPFVYEYFGYPNLPPTPRPPLPLALATGNGLIAASSDLGPGSTSLVYGDWSANGLVNWLWLNPQGEPPGQNVFLPPDYEIYTPSIGGSLFQDEALDPLNRTLAGTANVNGHICEGNGGCSAKNAFDIDGDGLTDMAFVPSSSNQQVANLTERARDGSTAPFVRSIGPITVNPTASPSQFGSDAIQTIADMDGDGLQDLVIVYHDSTHQLRFQTFLNRGDGRFGDDNPSGGPLLGIGSIASNVGTQPLATTIFRMGDLNGDGLADYAALSSDGVVICLRHGVPLSQGFWTCTAPTSPGMDVGQSDLAIVDTDASGIGRVVYFGLNFVDPVALAVAPGTAPTVGATARGTKPGLLQSIQTLGGLTTTINYETLRSLPNNTATPIPTWVVQSVTTTNGLTGSLARTTKQSYDYTTPIYDSRDRVFVGFASTAIHQSGDLGAPPVTQTTIFATASCQNPATGSTCNMSDYGQYRMLRGVPVNVLRKDDSAGLTFSATVNTYTEHDLNTSLDGRLVRRLALAQTDTYIADAGSTLTAAGHGVYVPPAGTPGPNATMAVFFPVGNTTHLQVTRQEDAFGNQTSGVDFGYVGVDSAIRTETDWKVPVGDPTPWNFRPIAMRVGYANDATGTSLGANVRSYGYDYYPTGQLKTISGSLSGTIDLTGLATPRAAGGPLGASKDNANVVLASLAYDTFGHLQVASGPSSLNRCTTYAYDSLYQQLPVATSTYPNGCKTGQALTTVQTWDRGLEVVTLKHGPFMGAYSPTTPLPPAPVAITRFDSFGRPVEVDQPNSGVVGATDPSPALTGPNGGIQYKDSGPIRSVRYQTIDGPETAPYYSDHVRFIDGFGDIVAKFDQVGANTSSSLWTLSGQHVRYSNGEIKQVMLPLSTTVTGDPTTLNVAALPFLTATASSATYDGLGRILTDTDYAQQTSQITYQSGTSNAAILIKTQDPEQLDPNSKHHGAFSLSTLDGHGRVVQSMSHVNPGNGSVDVTTTRTYLATGEMRTFTQTNPGGQVPTYTRWMQYDSLGRRVFNAEPNTTTNFTPTPASTGTGGVSGWTYAYNDAGEVVGTSDARGCGENIYRDGAGRLVAEDYSPCTSTQPLHTTPNATTGAGTEAFYVYDQFGRLSRQYDRAEMMTYSYDGRSRVTQIAKRLATPPAAAAGSGQGSGGSGPFTVSGFLTDANGNPLEGTLVTLSGTGGIVTTHTDRNGFYTFSVRSGSSASVLPTLANCTFLQSTVVNLNQIKASQQVNFEGEGPSCGGTPNSTPITPAGTVVISGTVTAPDGTGVPGLTINLNGGPGQAMTHTDPAGFYSFAGLSNNGNYSLNPGTLPSGCTLNPGAFNNLKQSIIANFAASAGCPPGIPSTGALLEGQYAPHVFQRSFQYDEANRVIESTTGADVPELAANGSSLQTAYLRQGIVSSVNSTYGALLQSQTVDAADAVTGQTFGDAAHTTSSLMLDPNETPMTFSLTRASGSFTGGAWAPTTPVAPTNPTEPTLQTVLTDLTLNVDKVGNPTLVSDATPTSQWPPGNEPTTSHSYSYDDHYRMIDSSIQYGGPGAPNDAQHPLYLALEREDSLYPPVLLPTDRVNDQAYQYDGRGNVLSSTNQSGTTTANDFSRSLGTVVTGTGAVTGPDQFSTAISPAGATLSAHYDFAGNLTLLANAASGSTYQYAWDEVGNLASSTRSDSGATEVTETYSYTPLSQTSCPIL